MVKGKRAILVRLLGLTVAFLMGILMGFAIKGSEGGRNVLEVEPVREDVGSIIGGLLDQDLRTRTFPLPEVITGASQKAVFKVEHDDEVAWWVCEQIGQIAEDIRLEMNAPESPAKNLRRINEASRFFEDKLYDKLNKIKGLSCSWPKTADGSVQRSGYPDLVLKHEESGRVFYLDPKLYEEKSRNSSLRTFYYTPRRDKSKIHESACHFLLGFAHDGVDGDWTFTGWELVDLGKTKLRLKAEFQASNRDLYLEESILLNSGDEVD